jgi:hypothetical protein
VMSIIVLSIFCKNINRILFMTVLNNELHRFPKCIKFTLSVHSKRKLFLNIHFGEETLKVLAGRISWGIKIGKLTLKIIGANLPEDNLNKEILRTLETCYEQEIQNEGGNENEINASFPISIIGKAKESSKTSNKIKAKNYVIDFDYSSLLNEPSWIFTVPDHQRILQGGLSELFLGTLDITGKNVSILATFTVDPYDIKLTVGKGFWDENIGENRRAWIEREIFLHRIRPQLQPYLSQIEVKP